MIAFERLFDSQRTYGANRPTPKILGPAKPEIWPAKVKVRSLFRAKIANLATSLFQPSFEHRHCCGVFSIPRSAAKRQQTATVLAQVPGQPPRHPPGVLRVLPSALDAHHTLNAPNPDDIATLSPPPSPTVNTNLATRPRPTIQLIPKYRILPAQVTPR